MPNMNHLKALGMTLAQWMELTEAQKVEANKKAAQIISDSHEPVRISYGSDKKTKHDTGGTQ
jgi:hypothetical protein